MAMIKKELAIANVKELLIDSSERDYNSGVRDSIRVLRDMDTVKQSKITNPDDYEELFDNMVYELLSIMCNAKGIELNSSSELLVDIRDSVIRHAENYHMDLTAPYKEYNVGDKVTIFFEGMPQQAIIINVGYAKYGLFLYHKNNVILIADESDCDSATSYIIELQKSYNVE